MTTKDIEKTPQDQGEPSPENMTEDELADKVHELDAELKRMIEEQTRRMSEFVIKSEGATEEALDRIKDKIDKLNSSFKELTEKRKEYWGAFIKLTGKNAEKGV